MATLLKSCFLFILIIPQVSAGKDSSYLLSPAFQVETNTTEKLVLRWETDSPHTTERILLFIPGPASSATCEVTDFQWQLFDDDKLLKEGNQTDFPPSGQQGKLPSVTLTKLGFMAGTRVATLLINLEQVDYRSNKKTSRIVFISGRIRITFSKMDPNPFTKLPESLDEVAQSLILNYPPLREIKQYASPFDFPSYLDIPCLKIKTRAHGVLSLPGKRIIDTWKKDVPIEQLALFRNRAPMPFLVKNREGELKTSGLLDTQDWIQWYSPVSQSPYSPETAIWMGLHPPDHREPSLVSNSILSASSTILERRIQIEEDHIFLKGKDKNAKQSRYWMWHDFLKEPTKSIPFVLPEQMIPTSTTAAIRITANQAYIALATDSLSVRLNGSLMENSIERDDSGEYLSYVPIQAGVLKAGTNTIDLTFTLMNQYSNSELEIYLDWIEIPIQTRIFPAEEPFYASGNPGSISIPDRSRGVWLIREEGLSRDDVWISPPGIQAFQIPDSTAEWSVYVVPDQHIPSDITLEPILEPLAHHPILTNPSSADVILVSPKAWESFLPPYEALLHRQGYRVRHVAVEDIYNLFGDGRLSPISIRKFLHYAYQRWDLPHPSYVLFIGDATWDYWGRYNNGVKNYVPAFREHELYPVENWFVRWDDPNDKIPDSIVARWPVQSASDLQIVIDKTIHYHESLPLDSWLNQLFVLTDDTFEVYSDELVKQWIPPGFRQIRRHIADYSLIDNIYLPEKVRAQIRSKTSLEATDEIIQTISRGCFLWEYFGHGAPNVMGDERMFFGGGSKYSDVKKLTNRYKLPILWAFTCETAKFDYPRDKWNISIGEDMLTFKKGGAIALVGATGRGYPTDHIVLARGMHEAAFNKHLSTLGQIFYGSLLLGYMESTFFEPANQYVILGDPTVRFPQFKTIEGTSTILENAISYEWDFSSIGRIPNPCTVWAETDKAILNPLHHSQSISELNMKGTYTRDPHRPLRKIGIDSITRQDNRIVVYHGAIPVPHEVKAATFIPSTTGCLPDLFILPDSIRFSPESPRSGETIFIHAKVRNKGQASATDISLNSYTVDDTGMQRQMTVAVGHAGARIKQLNPNEEASVRLRWDPIGNAGLQKIRLNVDPKKAIPESDETNNTVETELTVRRKADLVIDASSVLIYPIEDGKRMEVNFTIENRGESPAEKIVIELIRKGLQQPEPEEPFPIPQLFTLQPGARQTLRRIKMLAGIEYLDIVIDREEIVDEESHENNRYRYRP